MLRAAGPMSGDGGSHAASTKPFSRPCRLDRSPDRMRLRRQAVEHPFGKSSWMGATHFQMKTLKNVSTEMALPLTYNMKRAISILRVGDLIEALRI